MKTPMMELIEQLNKVEPQHFCSIETIKGWSEELLKKEKEVIMDAYNSGQQIPPFEYAEKYYNETFNTREK